MAAGIWSECECCGNPMEGNLAYDLSELVPRLHRPYWVCGKCWEEVLEEERQREFYDGLRDARYIDW